MRSATSGLSTQTRIALGVSGARGAQHVEPGAVAVIDLEPEIAGGPDHLDVGVDDRHVDALGQQRLGNDLGEAAEADEQHAAVQVGGVVDAVDGIPFPSACSRSSSMTISGVSAIERMTTAVMIAPMRASITPAASAAA